MVDETEGQLAPAGPRPLAHLTPHAGWANDPLGLTWHDGRYHVFTQYVPDRTEWAPTCHWAHAVSEDLMTWAARPVALAPGDGDGGVWSGSIVVPGPGTDEEPGVQLFYTSVDLEDVTIGRVRVASPTDQVWDSWVKGPVLAELPAGIDAVAFRDPYVLHDGTTWRMVLGGGLRDGTAVAWSWVSGDRRDWAFDGELARRASCEHDPVWTGEAWECPVLFPLQTRWVLVFSVWEPGVLHWVGYAVGDLVDGRFLAKTWGRLGYGPSYYASSTFVDREGRRGLVHWLRGVVDPDGRWAGAASIPQVLHLDGDTLVTRPHPDVTTGPVIGTVGPGERLDLPRACWVEWDGGSRADGDHHPPPALEALGGDGELVARLEHRGDEVVVTTPDVSAVVPTGRSTWVGLLVDALVLEVFTGGGALAVPLSASKTALALANDGDVGAVVRDLRGHPSAERS